MSRQFALAAALLLVLGVLAPPSLLSATFVVNDLGDAPDAAPDGICASALGVCTLRAAIQEGNVLAGADNITFAVTGTIALTSNLPTITGPLAIAGPGSQSLTVSGSSLYRPFTIGSGLPGGMSVSLSGLAIRDGRAPATGIGGGIEVAGADRLDIAHCEISSNSAIATGGGIAVSGAGVLNVSDVLFMSNGAGVHGGAIIAAAGSVVSIAGSNFSGNAAPGGNGGAIYSVGTLTLTDSTVTANSAFGTLGKGGGIYATRGASGPAASVTLVRTTIDSNMTRFGGGGVSVDNPGPETLTLTATNCTISGNTTTQSDGGGIRAAGLTNVILSNVTITGNSANTSVRGGRGGGISASDSQTVFQLLMTIVAQNFDPGLTAPECAGAISSQGYNIIGDNTGCSFAPAAGDQVGTAMAPVDPKLDPLAANGGPTQTHALLPGSPAIDGGTGAGCPGTDQRGVPRPRLVTCDIGSYEAGVCSGACFFTVTPCRVLDTRNPPGPLGGPPLTANSDRLFLLAGQCGVPITAAAVSINMTVTQPTNAGDLRIYPGGGFTPSTSVINYGPGQTRANNAIAPLGVSGELGTRCDQASGTVHLILDINGYFE